ncbi:MAG: SagB/ThcOx family dehydrogenase [Planctomycetota bacterium]|nr:SagB/ThcOx family dehydrogenase [Planctomycetota bacterium]
MTTHASPSLSERYQQATNYTPASLQGHPALDFSRQPAPFKTWHQARRILLPRDGEAGDEGVLNAAGLGRLLHHTYGVTLVREAPGMSMHYRASPSAGGLYPTEVYVAVRGLPQIPDGIFAYDAREHALVVCWEGDFGADIARHAFEHPAVAAASVVLIGTGLYERSAWRYGDRAYRRVLLDTGHVFGNAVVASDALDAVLVPVSSFRDEGIEELLLLDPAREGVLVLGAVLTREAAAELAASTPLRSETAHAAPAPEPGSWIDAVHGAGRMDAPLPAADPEARETLPAGLTPPVALARPTRSRTPASTLEAIRSRRSTRVYAPQRVPLGDLATVLSAAYPAAESAEPRARLAEDVLDTWVVTTGVEDLADGVHHYDPAEHTLTATRHGNAREALHRCCLWQELGRDCAFVVIHSIELPAAIAQYGERIYRAAHLDAGLLGQRLNLGALAVGLGASGIGGFFDEHLNALLGLSPRHAIVYVTTIGVPA